MWQTNSSKIVYQHKYLSILEDEVTLPNGHQTTYLKIQLPGNACSVIAQRADGKILLQKQYNYPSHQTLYEFPGGGVPFAEDPSVGANRELEEETGFKSKNITQIGQYFFNNRRSDNMMYVFYATDLVEGRLKRDMEEEQIELFWYSISEIDVLIRQGLTPNPSLLSAWCIFKQYN